MANRFFTVLIIPEKTSQVRRFVLPSWLVRGSLVGLFFVGLLGGIMLLDYWYVMSQINENKQLKIENRRLRQQVQIFKNKMTTVESTMDRVKTFATRLKVITNIEDRSNLIQSLNQKLPDASSNIGNPSAQRSAIPGAEPAAPGATSPGAQLISATASEGASQPAEGSAQGGGPVGPPIPSSSDPSQIGITSVEDAQLRREYEELDNQFSLLNHEALLVEQVLQDQYELLADQKAFLAALPTRKPAVGYFTSGFGVRRSPYGDRVKMHEGLDIANHPGTPIRAPADAVVHFADTKPGYGQTVILDHGYGLETWYGHAKRLLVSRGQRVRRGDVIALLGNSGRSTGPHVHYEVRVNGTPVDPLSYILEN